MLHSVKHCTRLHGEHLQRRMAPISADLFDEFLTQDTSVVLHAMRHLINPMDLSSWLGANRSDTSLYREDLQRRQGGKDAVLCAA